MGAAGVARIFRIVGLEQVFPTHATAQTAESGRHPTSGRRNPAPAPAALNFVDCLLGRHRPSMFRDHVTSL
ncbi:hypothetical protein AMK15_16890 [Streptomyces sp. MJM1172]|nr:hypothetical protein AMK15_16890 [Streptomyces sp. MJM1172]